MEKEQLLSEIQNRVSAEMEKRGYQTREQIDALVASQMKTFDGLDLDALRSLTEKNGEGANKLIEAMRAQGEEINKLKLAQGEGIKKEDLSLRGQIEKWQQSNKDAIEGLRNKTLGSAPNLTPLVLRAPATMTIAGSLDGSPYLPDPVGLPGIVDLVRVQPTFWERLRKSTIKANPLYWVNKVNKEGNAQFIGEGVLKPLASFELETQTSVPKKVAERMKISTELLYDLDYMATEMEREMRYEVMMAANTAVLTGTLSTTSPAGITTIASAYNLTTITSPNPTTADAIRAALAQIRSLNFTGTVTAYMNPIDLANMDIEKATDSGVYMLPPFASAENTRVKGVDIIEDNNIPVGYLLIGVMDLYRIGIHEAFSIRWGWENDDFSKNLVTAIGEMRFHQWYSSNHVGAWVYDSIVNIKAAIGIQQ